MSRAFVREQDGDQAVEALPDRPISPHPNLVTPEGLSLIDSTLTDLRERHASAQSTNDRAALAQIARDARYWTARRATAQVIAPPDNATEVVFGSKVTIARDDGRRQTWRIVGEDEADPSRGTLSYVSPVARAMIGRKIGDVVQAGNSEAEIVAIA
jgi:transcription elongation GreA/GreB family factor